MVLAQILKAATKDRDGVVQVSDTENPKLTSVYRYPYTPALELYDGAWVRGEVHGFAFSVLYLLSDESCPIYKVDFVQKRYATQSPDGIVVGWMKPKARKSKREVGSCFNF